MNLEKECKWYFGLEGPVENGPTNPTKGTFSSSPDIDIVREALQNSLDAHYDESKPVTVKFSFSKMRSADFPAFFHLRDHIKATLKAYENNDRAKEKFPTMINYLSGTHVSERFAEYIDVLTVGDYNTKGMPYEKGKSSSPFYAFLHSIGVSVFKESGAGGSNGLGKETIYERSAIKTLLISTRTVVGAVAFQGAARLATHPDPNDETRRVSKYGFYSKIDDEAITVEEEIPDCFKRSEPGTDIHIAGLIPHGRDEIRKSLVEAVLNHFWLAVYREKLIVDVDGVLIDKTNLPTLLGEHFPDVNDKHWIKNYEKWNPRPYFNAVVNAEAKKEKTAFEQKDSELLGHVRMYLDWSSDQLPKKVVFMRQPRMVIFKASKTSYPNFAAVFVCDHEIGNKALRCTEPPAHNDWDIKQFEGSDVDRERYKKCIKEVNDYVRDVLDKYFRSESSHNEIIIPGLAELLPDLEKSDEGVPGTVGSGSSDGLQPSGKIAAKETAAPVSFIDEGAGKESRSVLPNPSKGMASSLVEDMGLKPDEGADSPRVIEFEHPQPEPAPSGGGGGGGGGDPKEAPPQKMADKPGAKTLVQIRILFTPISYIKDGVLLHRLVLKPSPKEDISLYKNIRISIKTGTDNNTQDTADIKQIVNLPVGAELHGNEVRGLDVTSTVKLDVQFADRIKHSVKVVAYASK